MMPSDESVSECANRLILLPFYMRNLGHKTIQGHEPYIQGENGLFGVYLKFISKQSPKSWDDMVKAWGGEKEFVEMQRAVLNNSRLLRD